MRLVEINRTQRFDPAAFMKWPGWKIQRFGENEISKKIREFNPEGVLLLSVNPGLELNSTGNQLFKFRKRNATVLDGPSLEALWNNKRLIPESWKEVLNGRTRIIFFFGTVLLNEFGVECVLCLYWGHNRWHWTYRALRDEWDEGCVGAVLVK